MHVGIVDKRSGTSNVGNGIVDVKARSEEESSRAGGGSLSVAEKRSMFEQLSARRSDQAGATQRRPPPPKPARTFAQDRYLDPTVITTTIDQRVHSSVQQSTTTDRPKVEQSSTKPTITTRRPKRPQPTARLNRPANTARGVSHEYEHIFAERSPLVLRQERLRRSLSDDPVVYAESGQLKVVTSDIDVAPIYYASSPVPSQNGFNEDAQVASGAATKSSHRGRDSLPMNRERSGDHQSENDEEDTTSLGRVSAAVEKRVSRARMMRRKTLMHYDQQEIAFVKRRSPQLFEFAALVRLEQNDGSNPMVPPEQKYAPSITYRFPPVVKNGRIENGSITASLPCLCYPDISKAVFTSPDTYKDEQFVVTITDHNCDRKFAYCYRFVSTNGKAAEVGTNEKLSPSIGKPLRIISQNPCSSNFADEHILRSLPQVLCVVTPVRAPNFYTEFVREAAMRAKLLRPDQHPTNELNSFLQEAFRKPLPPAGGRLVLSGPCGKNIGILHRFSSSKGATNGLSMLVEQLGIDNSVLLFTALLSERRVLLVGESVPVVSKAVQAAASLLVPFEWPHTFIPVVPDPYLNLCFSPTPYLIGLLRSNLNSVKDLFVRPRNSTSSSTGSRDSAEDDDDECLLILDLCYGIVKDKDFNYDSLHRCLPVRTGRILKESLRHALASSRSSDFGTTMAINNMADIRDNKVADAFLVAFVDLIGHYREFLVTQQDGQVTFQKQQFVNGAGTNGQRSFLKWFIETGMFQVWLKKKLDAAAVAAGGGAGQRKCVTLGSAAGVDQLDRKLDQMKSRQTGGNAAYRVLLNRVIKRCSSLLRRHND